MSRTAPKPGRAYRSELRAQHAEETRARILDATGRVTARGIARLSIPAIAREAGVSVPTIYRHFGTKEGLLAAVYPYVLKRHGIREVVMPTSLADLRDRMRDIFAQLDSFDELSRAAMASPASREVRQLGMGRRLSEIGRLADALDPNLDPVDRDRIVRLLAILASSASLRMWRDHLGSSVDEAADDVEWILRAAVAAATQRPPQ